MKFGPQTADVEEVISFIESGQILPDRFDLERAKQARFKLRVVNSLDSIELYRNPWLEGTHISGRTWNIDIKTVDNYKWRSARGYTGDSKVYARLSPLFRKEGSRFFELLQQQIGTLLPAEEIEFIAQDMENLIRRRADVGISRYMPERFFAVYQAGGYPCGWEGRYPNGRMVVFTRDKTAADASSAT